MTNCSTEVRKSSIERSLDKAISLRGKRLEKMISNGEDGRGIKRSWAGNKMIVFGGDGLVERYLLQGCRISGGNCGCMSSPPSGYSFFDWVRNPQGSVPYITGEVNKPLTW